MSAVYEVAVLNNYGAVVGTFDYKEGANALYKWAKTQPDYSIRTALVDGVTDEELIVKKSDSCGREFELNDLVPSYDGICLAADHMIGKRHKLFTLNRVSFEYANFTKSGVAGAMITVATGLTKKEVFAYMKAAVGEEGYGDTWVYFPFPE